MSFQLVVSMIMLKS